MSTIHLLILAIHLLATVAKLLRPGGVRAVVAESVLLKHQLVISSRARRRAPNLNSFDRFVLGLGSLFVPAGRVPNGEIARDFGGGPFEWATKPEDRSRLWQARQSRSWPCSSFWRNLLRTGGGS